MKEMAGLPYEDIIMLKSESPRIDSSRTLKLWVDRVTGEERMDFSKTFIFSDSDPDDQPTGLVEVSGTTQQFLQQICIRRMPNKERLAKRSCYPLLKVAVIRTPQLDGFMKAEVSSVVKSADRECQKCKHCCWIH